MSDLSMLRGGPRRAADTSSVGARGGGLLTLLALLAVLLSAATLASSARADEFDRVGQLFGTRSEGLSPPQQQRIAVVHSTGNILVTNLIFGQVDVYAPAVDGGRLLTSFGAGELTGPFGVAVDQRTGAVYVSDSGNGRIARYTITPGDPPTYTLDGTFTSPVAGSGVGEVGNFAAAMAIDGTNDKLLVADPGNNRVMRYTLAGAYDGLTFTGDDSPDRDFTGLLDLAVDSTGDAIVIDSNGDIANGDGDSRVLRFGATGRYEDRIGASLLRPATVAIRPFHDEVFISWNQDAVKRDEVPRLDMFDSTGMPIGSVALPPNNAPTGVAYTVVTGVALANGEYGRLYTATDSDRSSYNGQYGMSSVQVLSPPSPPAIGSETAFDVRPNEGKVGASIFSSRADTTYHLEYGLLGGGYPQSSATVVLPRAATAERVAVRITGLLSDTTYQYRLVADNGIGSATVSRGGTFTTAPPLPLARLGAVTDVAGDAATLHAEIDTLGREGSYAFSVAEVGGSARFTLPLGTLPAAFGAVPVSARVQGLTPGTTYTVGVYAYSDGGLTLADPVVFATAGAPAVLVPARQPDNGTAVYGCGAPRLNGVGSSVRNGQVLTLTGSDLGIYGVVTFGEDQAEVRSYAANRVTVVVPADLRGRTRLTLDCGAASSSIDVNVGSAPSNKPTISKVTVRGTRATLAIKVPGRGTLTASGGRHLRGATLRVSRSGTATVRVALSRAGKKALNKARSNTLRVTLRVVFKPSSGRSQTVRTAVVFRG